VIGLALLAFAACGERKAPSDRPAEASPVPVRVETTRLEPVPLEIQAVGTVRARTHTLVASNLQAYVVEVRAREGLRVAAGDLLVRLDDRDAAAQVARAEAARQGAAHALDEARQAVVEARTREAEARAALTEAQGALEALGRAVDEAAAVRGAADSHLALAEATLRRYRQMFEARAVSPQEHDEVVARERAARAEVERARARAEGAAAALAQQRSRIVQAERAVDAAGIRIRGAESRGDAARARIREADAEAARARVQLAHTRIVAPAVGLVVEKSVEVGELALPGRVLVRLDDPSGYRLEAPVPAADAARLRVGQQAEARMDGTTEAVLVGRIAEILPEADPATRTVLVKVDLPATASLRSGLFGRLRVTVGETPRLRVSAGAIVERGQLAFVYVVDPEGVARLRLVTPGARRDDRVEVLAGLVPGEEIVVDGAERLADGTRVGRGS
jgi:RND family efflux transporter MFP subunit